MPDLIDGLRAVTTMLWAVVVTADPETRAIIRRFPQVELAAPAAFAPRGALELILHTYDIAKGLDVPFEPPRDVCARLFAATDAWPARGDRSDRRQLVRPPRQPRSAPPGALISRSSGESGPGREGEARRRHVLEGDDAAGERVGREQGAEIGAAEAAVGGEAVAVDREEVDDGAVGVDDADAVLDGRRHVEAAVDVEAEAVAAAAAEGLDHPLARAVGMRRAAARARSTTTRLPSGSNAMPLQYQNPSATVRDGAVAVETHDAADGPLRAVGSAAGR